MQAPARSLSAAEGATIMRDGNKSWPAALYMLSFVLITLVSVIFAEEAYKKTKV